MRHHRARQPPVADGARAPAIDFGHAADHAQVRGQRRHHIGQGQRDQRGGGGDGAGGGLDLAPGLLVQIGQKLRLNHGDQGFGVIGVGFAAAQFGQPPIPFLGGRGKNAQTG